MDNLHFSVSSHLLLMWYIKQIQVESFLCCVNRFTFVHNLYKLLVPVFMTFLFWFLNHRLTPIRGYFSWHNLFITWWGSYIFSFLVKPLRGQCKCSSISWRWKALGMWHGIIRIITKSDSKTSCRQLFKQLEILPLQSQYILSTLLFVIKNKNLYTTNQNIHTINTRFNSDLHLPICNLTLYQKGAYFSGIMLFNHLPLSLKRLSNDIKVFKPALRRFLKQHSYSVEEYFQLKTN